MSNEVRANITVSSASAKLKIPQMGGALQYDETSEKHGNPGIVTLVSAVEEDLAFGDVTPGLVFIQNLDATATVIVGPKSGGVVVPFTQLRPGKHVVLEKVAGTTWRVLASGNCNIYVAGFSV